MHRRQGNRGLIGEEQCLNAYPYWTFLRVLITDQSITEECAGAASAPPFRQPSFTCHHVETLCLFSPTNYSLSSSTTWLPSHILSKPSVIYLLPTVRSPQSAKTSYSAPFGSDDPAKIRIPYLPTLPSMNAASDLVQPGFSGQQ